MIGAQLKYLRCKNKYTISQLCELIGINQNTYSKYERDERDVSTSVLNTFADFYGVTADYLLGRNTSESDSIDHIAVDEMNITALEKEILDNYMTLPESTRNDLMEFLIESVKKVQSERNN